MKNFRKRKIRSNKAQIQYICQYMANHPNLALADYRSPMAAVQINTEWAKLKEALDLLGPIRSVEQWKICWRDQKVKARTEGASLKRAIDATGNILPAPNLSDKSAQVLSAIGEDAAVGLGPEESPGTWRDMRNNIKKKAIQNKKMAKSEGSDGHSLEKDNEDKARNSTNNTPLLTPTEQKQREKFISAESAEILCDPDVILSKPKEAFQKLVKAKLSNAVLRRQLIIEELGEKKLIKQILREEIIHKRELCELEKQEKLLKIEILKLELENKRKLVTN